jgi:hypothetical protein
MRFPRLLFLFARRATQAMRYTREAHQSPAGLIIEGEAEGPLAIWVFLILALAAIGFTAWGFRS